MCLAIGVSIVRRSYRVQDRVRCVRAIRPPRTLLDGWVDEAINLEGEERRRFAIARGGRREPLGPDEPAKHTATSGPGL